MNKTAIKNFAIWARNKLIADIKYKAGLMGITEKGIAGALPQSAGGTEFYDIGTSEPYCISGKEIEQRRRLKEVIENKAADTDYSTAYKYVIEEVAYTWFNRLIAVRFMEVNDYLPGHIRVLSSETGKMEPDLVTTPFDSELEFTSTEEERIIQLKQDNKIDELFRMLFIKQCNALNELLPALFEKTNDYTEILLNLSVIDQEGVVYHLVHDIPEEDFDVNRGGQVEIIGWLYQYYNTEPKNDAFAKKGKITKEEIPAVTQLFTPDWIVRYMVENSLGRLWLEGHPDDTLKANWKYYLDEAEQDPEVQSQLDAIKKEHAKLNPEDIKLIDPCMGSGHILVYAFDVFMQIYESAGWSQRDAAKSIIENNIYGLDIDDRAFQMAYFAVLMKARQYNRRILNSDVMCHVYSIQESNGITREAMNEMGSDLTKEELEKATKQINELVKLFNDAKEYGSIIDVPEMDWKLLREYVVIYNDGQIVLDLHGSQMASERLQAIINIAEIMAKKYSVTITNPPYMGNGNMSTKLSSYIKSHYNNGRNDMFAVFIDKCMKMTIKNGFQAMITQHQWMFLSSYSNIREKLLTMSLINMAHLGARAFEEISGEVVQTTSFVLQKCDVANYTSLFKRLVDYPNQAAKEQAFRDEKNTVQAKCDALECLPGSALAYWVSENMIKLFSMTPVDKVVTLREGIHTGKNEVFLRSWSEVGYDKLVLGASDYSDVDRLGRWVPYNKGGSYRKWYGNNELVIGFDETYRQRMSCLSGHVRPSQNLYFKEGCTWSALSSGKFGLRCYPKGFLFDSKGQVAVGEKSKEIMGLFNLRPYQKMADMIMPTLDYKCGDVKKLPYCPIDNASFYENVDECIAIAKEDWDSYETSWEFKCHPLCNSRLVSLAYKKWEDIVHNRFERMVILENQLNDMFAQKYGLSKEDTGEYDEKDITLNTANMTKDVKSLISYAIGCMFGRYSLNYEGLAYAGGTFDDSKYSTFIPDVDGIIPITDEEYLEDDIVGLFCAWLKKVYGEETLEENLDFIAKALGKKGNSSREIIRNYFLTDLYKDHCSTYSVTGSGKRPIYWLFDSGKQNGFKALIYLHRYTPDTIGNLRVDYLHRMQRVYESEMNRMQDMIEHSTNSREVAAASKRKEKLQKQLKECREYDEKIGHLALDRIELDLDDGVKYNYRKIQTGRDGKFYEVLADSKSIMMDAKKYADFKK